jgi:hypothetical protein
MTDMVNRPSHYTFGKYEVIDVLEDWFPNEPLLWQVCKYLPRWDKKGDPLENLEKAEYYLKRKIAQLKEQRNGTNNTNGSPRITDVPEWLREGMELERPTTVRKLSEEDVLRKDSEGAGTKSTGAGKGDQNPRSLGELLKERINELDSRDRKGGGSAKRITITRRNRGA